MTSIQNPAIQLKDGRNVDAFNRLRVSNNHILLSGTMVHADRPLVWDTQLTGTGTATHNVSASCMALATAALNDEVIRQTKRHWLYRTGQSQVVRVTFSNANQVANVRKRAGYFDADDGLFLEINGTVDVALVHRTSTSGAPVETRIVQSAWMDPLDGTGESGVTLDWTKAQHLVIDFQWLGVGRARLGFEVGGLVHYVHELNFANVGTTAYMRSGSLPVRYELKSLAAVAGAFDQICAGVVREGGTEEEGIATAITSPLSGATRLTGTTTARSGIVVRLKAAWAKAFIKPIGVELINQGTSAQYVMWQLVLNPTLGGAPVYTAAGQSMEAATELAQQQTYTAGTGHVIAAGVVNGGNGARAPFSIDVQSLLGAAADIAGTADTLALILTSATGTPAVTATLSVLEFA